MLHYYTAHNTHTDTIYWPAEPVAEDTPTQSQQRGMYSYVASIAKPKAAWGLCFHQLGDHAELLWLMRKYDLIHKTGST